MTKDEVLSLAKKYECLGSSTRLHEFANACEKIGMEKARDSTIDECNEYLSTDALLALKKVTR